MGTRQPLGTQHHDTCIGLYVGLCICTLHEKNENTFAYKTLPHCLSLYVQAAQRFISEHEFV